MNKQILQPLGKLIVSMSFIFFISCEKEMNALTGSTDLSSKENKTTTFTSNEKQPIHEIVFVACANGGLGENVELTGTIHILIHTTFNGNNFSTKYHFQPQGISGVGQTTGIKYQGSGVTQEEIKGSITNGKYIDTYINNFKIVGKGVNYRIHVNTHITVNANGETTASVDNFTSDCK